MKNLGLDLIRLLIEVKSAGDGSVCSEAVRGPASGWQMGLNTFTPVPQSHCLPHRYEGEFLRYT